MYYRHWSLSSKNFITPNRGDKPAPPSSSVRPVPGSTPSRPMVPVSRPADGQQPPRSIPSFTPLRVRGVVYTFHGFRRGHSGACGHYFLSIYLNPHKKTTTIHHLQKSTKPHKILVTHQKYPLTVIRLTFTTDTKSFSKVHISATLKLLTRSV